MPSFRTLARNHDFTALWVGATTAELGTRVTTFAAPLVAYALTRSALWAAAAEAAWLLGLVVTLLPAGVLADRRHRLRIMRLSLGAGVLLYASLAVAGALGALTIGHLLVVLLATGVVTGLFGPAEYSSIRAIVSDDELPTALSQQQARQHVAALLGGPLGGALYGLARWAPFATNAVMYAVGWLLLGRVRADLAARPATPGAPAARPLQDIAEGARFIWGRPFLRVLLFWSPAVNLTTNALFFVALLRLIDAGFPAGQIGLVEAAMGAFGVLGAIAAPTLVERFATGRLTVLVAWSFVPLAIPLAFWNHPLSLATAASVGVFLNPAGNAGVGAYRMAITPRQMIGRVQSTTQFVSMVTMPLAPALAGALLTGLGGRDAVLACVGATAALALVPTLAHSVRSVPRPAAWPRLEEPAPQPVAV
ncbi:MFS transporter [Nocardioides ginsengisoli]|uniref:MFS transporter n=1 Tax=Nocardioides ginsengisoli TaxID=363868 RepID=A0ABW3W5Z6_9ACTN